MGDRFKNLAKNGWHPEKSKASGSSAASDSKFGQVVGSVAQLPKLSAKCCRKDGWARHRAKTPMLKLLVNTSRRRYRP